MQPIISYYGGKQRLASKIIPYIPKHTVYCEPFCGGATILFKKPYPDVIDTDYREIINDIDNRLIIFYKQLQNNPDKLIWKIKNTLYSEAEYKKSGKILRNPNEYSELDRAWAYYVNVQQGFSKVLLSGWGRSVFSRNLAITWRNKISVIENYIDRMASVHISSTDALTFIKQFDSPQTFFYIDPPYPGTDQGMYKGFSVQDYKELIKLLNSISGSFILSNYQQGLEPDNCKKVTFDSYCSASNKGKVNIDKSKKSIDLGNRKREEIIYIRQSKTPRAEIIKLYESGRYNCFTGDKNKYTKQMNLFETIRGKQCKNIQEKMVLDKEEDKDRELCVAI